MLEAAGVCGHRGSGLGRLNGTLGGGIGKARCVGGHVPVGLGFGLEPEFQVSSVRPSCVFPKAVGAIGNFILLCSFSAHNLMIRVFIFVGVW